MVKQRRNGRGGARPGSGPKPKPAAERQRHPVTMKLTDGELKALKAAAARKGDALGAYARKVLLRHLGRLRS